MATENDDSRSMNGILSNISRDVVDTSWDIPPLTFPKLQPTDSEEADGADGASLAEPRTIASSVPAQTEQPVSAAPTIADIPSMPLDTIDFDDAVAPADAEETATLPPLVSSTDEQDVEATQAFDTSDGITDLEELAAEDPEHDPLKTIPVAPKEPSADKWKIIAIVAAIAAVAVAIAGVIVVRNRINRKNSVRQWWYVRRRNPNTPKPTKNCKTPSNKQLVCRALRQTRWRMPPQSTSSLRP